MMSEHHISITDHQTLMVIDRPFLESVIQRVLVEEQVESAIIGLILVDDQEIHRINQQYLGHDYPTDVISFPLHESADVRTTVLDANHQTNSDTETEISSRTVAIEGELIVSTETANREAVAHGWSPDAELLLYIVHGLLHICGYDDIADEERPRMRNREREILALWGLCPTGLEA